MHQKCNFGWSKKNHPTPLTPWLQPIFHMQKLGPRLEMFHNFPCAQRSQGRLCTCNPIIQGGTWFSKLQSLLGREIMVKNILEILLPLVSLPLPVYGQNLAKLLGLKLNGYGPWAIKHFPNIQWLWNILSPGISCI